MSTLTDRQRDVVLAVADLTSRYGYPPTYREIAAAVATTSTETVARAVLSLRRAGILRPAPTYNRCLTLAADVAVSRDGRIARVMWVEGLGPVPRPLKPNAPGHREAEGAHIANDREGVEAVNIIPDAEHRRSVIDGLRRLATYLDEHPDVPVGFTPVSLEFAASGVRSEEEARAEVDRVAALIGAATETSASGTYSASKCFGAATYRVYASSKASGRRVTAALSYLDNVTPDGEAS